MGADQGECISDKIGLSQKTALFIEKLLSAQPRIEPPRSPDSQLSKNTAKALLPYDKTGEIH
jgi:hypothetical protein